MPAHLLPISRRRFLAGSAATLTAFQSGMLSADESPSDPDSYALLSDTHLLSESSIARHYAGNKAMEKRAPVVLENLSRAAGQVNALPNRPAGVLLNGDCVHVGGKDEYQLLADKFALLKTFPIHVTMGNHDHRGDFKQAFDKHTQGKDRVLLEKRHVSVVKSRHANLVMLDSLTMQKPESPVKGPGILGSEQLNWLESVLDSHSDKPAILMFHHNIDPSEDYQKQSGAKEVVVESASPFKGFSGGLEDSDQLLKLLVAKPHVKAIVTGHMHQFRIFKWQKIDFVSLPSVGYTFDAKEPVAWLRMQLQSDGAVVELQTLDKNHPRHQTRADLRWS